MDLVLFGIQGSGKGTLGKAIADKYGFEIFETGSELRKLSQEDTELGRKVKSIIDAGHLVPNEVVMDIIENFMGRLSDGKKVIFDGIPRKSVQAETFDALMKKLGRDFMGILIDVPENTAVRRLSLRRLCSKCKNVFPASYKENKCDKCGGDLITRTDDNPESIRTRLKAYFDETTPVIDHYKKEKRLLVMNGDQSIEDAEKEILELIDRELSDKLS
jgi:adenylate kinase